MAISDYNVQPNEAVVVSGTLTFSSLLTKTQSKGKYPRDEYQAVIEDPVITAGENTALGNYIRSTMYTTNAGKPAFRATSIAPLPIRIYDRTVVDPNGVQLEHELASGQHVDIAISSFMSRNYDKVGVGMNAVCIQDARNIKYRNSANGQALSLFGLSPQQPTQQPNGFGTVPTQAPQTQQPFGGQAQPQAPQANPAPQQPFGSQGQQQAPQQPFATPAYQPNGAGQQAPQQQPFGGQVQQPTSPLTAPFGAPTQPLPQTPQANPAPQQPVGGQPQQQQQPFGGQAPQQPTNADPFAEYGQQTTPTDNANPF